MDDAGVTNFVAKHIAEYGLSGTNNVMADDFTRQPLPACTRQFTRDNHFRFGFGEHEFNCRTCVSAKYWVEYGAPTRPHEPFGLELERAVRDIADRRGRFSVTGTTSYIARGVVAAAEKIGADFEQIVVEIAGSGTPPHDPRLPVRRRVVSWDEFARFVDAFAGRTGCPDPWIALEAYHGE